MENAPILKTEPDQGSGLAVYIHWPFCKAKCPYCDFNSHVEGAVDHDLWRDALLSELEHFARLSPGRAVTSIFFGGGTPSLMAPQTTGALIEAISKHWHLASNAEITLEANPTSSEAEKFADFRAAGVNRLSLGVQSFEEDALKFLGREHSVSEARDAIALSQSVFPQSSFDLIYARPDQSAKAWTAELGEALSLAAGHLSLYQLTVEEGTPFAAYEKKGGFRLPGDDLSSELFELTGQMMTAAGYEQYEISNFARPGFACRQNLTYWRYGDYVGVGPGAHGRISRSQATLGGAKSAYAQIKEPKAWLASVGEHGHGGEVESLLERDEMLAEMLIMGLRLSEGVSRIRSHWLLGKRFESLLPRGPLEKLIAAGFLELDHVCLRATDKGRLRLNAILDALLND